MEGWGVAQPGTCVPGWATPAPGSSPGSYHGMMHDDNNNNDNDNDDKNKI